MKLNSKYFDDIRVKPENDRKKVKQQQTTCQWEGCEEVGEHRAPGGKDALNKYRYFCLKHVREYNAKYDYFDGMDDDSVRTYQKQDHLGHRPTWTFGVEKNKSPDGSTPPPHMSKEFLYHRWRQEHEKRAATRSGNAQPAKKKVSLTPAAQKAFDTMGLEGDCGAEAIKVKYKELVKRLHPDANGGDRKYEERLREIIAAYTYLKRSGYL